MNILQKNLVTLRKGLLKAGYGYEETSEIVKSVYEQRDHVIEDHWQTSAQHVINLFFSWGKTKEGRAYWERTESKLGSDKK